MRHPNEQRQASRVQIQGDERELSSSSSIISFNWAHFPQNVINDLDAIYTHRRHSRCMIFTYLTLLSMTLAVIFWMIYWFLSNRGENLYGLFICQIGIWVFLIASPIFFILMVISWLIFACRNPIDRLRNHFIGFRLEGVEWRNQLEHYFEQQRVCLPCRARLLRQKLVDRNVGYILLSSRGILFDQLFLRTSHQPMFARGTLIDHGRVLKLEGKHLPKREFWVYLPEELINHDTVEALVQILQIPIDSDALRQARF